MTDTSASFTIKCNYRNAEQEPKRFTGPKIEIRKLIENRKIVNATNQKLHNNNGEQSIGRGRERERERENRILPT